MRKLKNNELNRISPEEYKSSDKTAVIIVLDNVRSLYNVGSVFGTVGILRVEAIYLCGITGKPPHAEIHKSEHFGATESWAWKHFFEKTMTAIRYLRIIVILYMLLNRLTKH